MYLTVVKTLFGIWELFVIFLLIEGWIGSIKRLVQVSSCTQPNGYKPEPAQAKCLFHHYVPEQQFGGHFQFFANIHTCLSDDRYCITRILLN
ncbi:MAG: hypothetical protein A2W17_00950 [Planctomycetes bacterium RBG_16_41_13]|nr:MAG: hypothetical protein A2W17_00950 [Planctomycetes bacterium RBG_16_41_13]